MDAKHTIGPWRAVLEPAGCVLGMGEHFAIYSADNTTVLRSVYLTQNNANVIAAAPEMLAVLMDVERLLSDLPSCQVATSITRKRFNEVRAAIAKATGA